MGTLSKAWTRMGFGKSYVAYVGGRKKTYATWTGSGAGKIEVARGHLRVLKILLGTWTGAHAVSSRFQFSFSGKGAPFGVVGQNY